MSHTQSLNSHVLVFISQTIQKPCVPDQLQHAHNTTIQRSPEYNCIHSWFHTLNKTWLMIPDIDSGSIKPSFINRNAYSCLATKMLINIIEHIIQKHSIKRLKAGFNIICLMSAVDQIKITCFFKWQPPVKAGEQF